MTHDDTVYKRAYHNVRATLKRLYRWQQRDIESRKVRPDEHDWDKEASHPFIDDPVDEFEDELD